MSATRQLNPLRAARVLCDEEGLPTVISWQPRTPGRRRRRRRVELVLDRWHVDDAWWTGAPVRRIYHECQLVGGQRVLAVYDQLAGSWHVQR